MLESFRLSNLLGGVALLAALGYLGYDYSSLRTERAAYRKQAAEVKSLREENTNFRNAVAELKAVGKQEAEKVAVKELAARPVLEKAKPLTIIKPESRCQPYLELEKELLS